MKPARIFVILAFLTASALAIVHLRVSNIRVAHRIQQLHEQEWKLRQQCVRQEAEIAARSTPRAVQELGVKSPAPPVPDGRDSPDSDNAEGSPNGGR